MFFFFILFNGGIVTFFIKSFIVGLGKIIPGVSGALLAINFNIYEDIINAIIYFFSNPKKNLKLLTIFGLGILLAMILGSGIILYLINNYRFLTLSLFVGLISGGTYNFAREINYNIYNAFIIGVIVILFIVLGDVNYQSYIMHNTYYDNIIFFIGGIIEVISSVIPGISGTSLLMLMGLYEHVLMLINHIYDLNYIITNINLYLSYGMGMFLAFIFTIYFVNYMLKKHRNLMYLFILGLSLGSISVLLKITFLTSFCLIEFFIGLIMLILGIILSFMLNK